MNGGFATCKEPLYPFPIMCIIRRDECHRLTAVLCSRRTSDTMHIVFRSMWHVIIDNQRNIRHINTTGHHICRDQHIHLPVLEIQHHLIPFTLFQIAMHRARVNL